MEDLPSDFDLIVVGTGITESIVAAAASRNGKTVLHIDPNEFYGGIWASFNLKQISKCCEQPQPNFDCHLTNFTEIWYNFEENGTVQGYDKDKVLSEFRKFSIDLMPTVLFSSGGLVELLVSSNISRYAEFRAVDRIASHFNDKIITVPCSRADVFNNRDLNVVEKRILMKFMQTCLNSSKNTELAEHIKDKTFKQFLQTEKLTAKLLHFVLYSIAMADEQTKCCDGIANVKKFLKSLGRYGNTSFLFPMYGSGEMPQCFCRLCAVFGGIYCLSRKIDCLHFTPENEFKGIQWGEQRINGKHIVFGPHAALNPAELFTPISATAGPTQIHSCGELSRAIFITATPLGGFSQNTGGGGVTFMKLPPIVGMKHKGVHVFQLSHSSGTCPKGLYLIHLVSETIDSPIKDLQPYINLILKTNKTEIANTDNVIVDETISTLPDPATEDTNEIDKNLDANPIPEQNEVEETIPIILWSFYFKIPKCNKCEILTGTLKSGVHICCGPHFDLDYDLSIAEAKEMFNELYPNEEFLPRAPDPEEIIYGDEDESKDEAAVSLDSIKPEATTFDAKVDECVDEETN